MSYEKDIYGNVIGTGGDDTSLQNEKMAGYPGYNLFDKQREAAVLTQGEIEGKTGVSLGAPAVVNTAPTGSQIANYVQGNGGMPQDLSSRPNVLGAGTGRPAMNVTKDGRGNYYVDGVKTPMTVFNPNAVPTVNYGPITSTEQLAAAMGYTSPQEEERLRKASVTNQRIMAIGDALRHIGNIANTVRYAPSQQFNSPVLEEEKRYEKGKALRDAANARYISYKQAKERQDAAQKQWETQFKYNMAKDAANFELKKNESEAKQQRQKALAELDKARLEGQIDKNTYQRLVNKFYPETAQAKITEIESRVAKNNRTNVGGSNGGGRRKVKAGSGGGKYWIDVPGEGRIYYQNKTMWQQGIESHSDGSDRYENVQTGKDAAGRPQTKQVRTPWEQRSVNIQRGKTNINKGKTPSKGSQGSKGGSGKTQGKTTAKGRTNNGYGGGTRSALNKIIGGK